MAKKEPQADNLQLLKTQLKKKEPGRLYVFYGEETFLRNHYLGRLKKLLLDEVTESFNFHRLNTDSFDVRTLLESVEALPVMAERTMVQVDDVDLFKLGEAERGAMTELLTDIPEWCTVVLTYETTQWRPDKRQKKLWEAIERHALIVEFAKQGQRELVSWVTRHFAARGKRISGALCAYLIEITGGTMTALAGEIAKIAAYSGAEEICRADIDAVTEPVLDAVAFQMTDLMGEGRYAQALEKLQQLLKLQLEPLAILGAIGASMRRISAARTLLDCGRGAGDLMKLCGIADYPARKAMASARRFPASFCCIASEFVLETDYRIKTSYDEPERLLEMLLMRMSQEAHNG